MGDEMTPQAALAAVASARSAAPSRAVPGWFPAASASACAAGLTLGASTGRLGWTAIAAGWLLGVALWYRLRSFAT